MPRPPTTPTTPKTPPAEGDPPDPESRQPPPPPPSQRMEEPPGSPPSEALDGTPSGAGREQGDAMARSIQSLQSRTSRKARIQDLDSLAAAGERAGPAGIAQLIEEHEESVWGTLLDQCLHSEPLVRVYALRALRKMALDSSLAKQLFEHRFIIPLMRAFDTDSISLTFPPRMDPRRVKESMMKSEKLQALKLIVHLVQVGAEAMPRGVCMLLISVAEDRKSEDTQFRRMCLETLRDLMVRNTDVVASCNGIQTLIKEMLSTDSDAFAQSVAYNLLYVLNDPRTRCLIRPDDLRMLFAPFTDSDVKVDERRKEQLESSSRVIVTMMRSWTGLFFLCSDKFGLETLVKTLLLPERTKIKQAIFKTIVNILRIAAPSVSTKTMGPPEFSAFSPGGSLATGTSSRSILSPTSSSSPLGSGLAPRSSPQNLLDNYAAVLVLALVHAGLLEALQRLGEGFDVEIAALANELMSDLMDLSDQLFPRNMCLALHRLPRLVSDACDFRPGADALARERACIVVTHLQKCGAGQVGSLEVEDHERAATVSQLRWIREQVDSRMQTDKWMALRSESKVDTVSYKECEQWDWEKLSDMVNGPLRNPSRLHEILRTDFVKAVLSVILPSKQRLERMRRSPDTEEYIKVECQLLELLIQSEEARKHKTVVRLMQELKELLDCEWKDQGKYSTVFAPRNFTDRVVRDYFTIIGTITSTPLGRDLLDNLSTGVSRTTTTRLLLNLCTRSARLDITRTIVSSLRYEATHDNIEILQVVLTARECSLRRSATQHLLHLCRAGTAGFENWGIDSLVTQLNDVDDSVVLMALDILLEACDIDGYLNAAVLRNPTQRLSQLSKKSPLPLVDPDDSDQRIAAAAHDMLLRFAGHNQGVQWLQDLPRDSQGGDTRGWISVEIEEWDKTKNIKYVEQVEEELVNVLRNDIRDGPEAGGVPAGMALKNVALPTHLYGQLGATANGCQLLRQNVGKLEKWASLLDGAGAEPGSNAHGRHTSDRELRAALWVVGHVGASEHGWSLLEDTVGDVMATVAHTATTSPMLSMRGTCLYIVGMLSTTAAARERLAELKWARADERSVAMPDAFNSGSRAPQLFSVQPLEYVGSWARQCAIGARTPADTRAIEREIDEYVRRRQLDIEEGKKVKVLLGHAADMQNTVMLQEGKAGLLRLKKEAPRLFTKPIVLVLLYSMMDGAPMALRVRRFLQRLFERIPVADLAHALREG